MDPALLSQDHGGDDQQSRGSEQEPTTNHGMRDELLVGGRQLEPERTPESTP